MSRSGMRSQSAVLEKYGLNGIWAQTLEHMKKEEDEQAIRLSQCRMQALQRLSELGLGEDALGEIIEISPRMVRRYLRYGRFIVATECMIAEYSFWLYWLKVCDSSVRLKPSKIDSVYENQVFMKIAELIEHGVPPPPILRRRSRLSPAKIAQLREPIKRLSKELHARFEREILPPLEELKPLLHASRATWSPTLEARIAMQLEEGFKHFLDYLDSIEQVFETMTLLTDEEHERNLP